MIGAWLSLMTETVTTAVAETANSGLTALPLVSKGLLTTLFGLLGVFLVLLLFFFAIKLMQRLGKKDAAAKE